MHEILGQKFRTAMILQPADQSTLSLNFSFKSNYIYNPGDFNSAADTLQRSFFHVYASGWIFMHVVLGKIHIVRTVKNRVFWPPPLPPCTGYYVIVTTYVTLFTLYGFG